MKKAILTLVGSSILLGCSKDDSEYSGNLAVSISYKVSEAGGSKPDAGASAYLYKQTGREYNRVYIDYKIGYLTDKATSETVRPDYSATADASGNATINNIAYGKYLLVVSSKGRNVYSVKPIEINSSNISLSKNFGTQSDFKDEGESW